MNTENQMITDNFSRPIVNIKIVGVGGAGNSVLEKLSEGLISPSVELVAINTDARALQGLDKMGIKSIQIGESITGGYGTGGDWEKGELAATKDEGLLREFMKKSDMLFITSGLGGGAGSGITPVVAKIAKEQGILAVAIVTVPFHFEGNKRNRVANASLMRLEKEVDALIVIQNDKLMTLPEAKQLTISNAFKLTDEVLERAVMLITQIITTTGELNIDFADVRTVLRQSPSSDAVFAMGESKVGDLSEAIEKACSSPLLKRNVHGAQGAILYIIGPDDLSMYDINMAIIELKEKMAENANIIWGYLGTQDNNRAVKVLLIGTDFIN